MTPKEKAKNLVFKYQHLVTSWDCYNDQPTEIKFKLEDMKKCALICVDEINENLPFQVIKHKPFTSNLDYWKEVKKELNKL